MGTTNVFMNAYKQAENKLTYNFLCLVEHMPFRNEFVSFLLDNKFDLVDEPPVEIETVFGGYESNPDGMIKLKTTDGKTLSIYFENKTWRCDLEETQLQNHLRVFCSNQSDILLVITPRNKDKAIASKLNNPKVFFKTWSQVADKLKTINTKQSSFVLSQFLEYGNISREFVEIPEMTKNDIGAYLSAAKRDTEQKFYRTIECLSESLDLTPFKFAELDWTIKNHWGRFGLEFKFNPKSTNYGQWFFFGIYYDTSDHGLRFKKGVPELAFFFDINEKEKEKLINNQQLICAINRLCNKGFEENLTVRIANAWRLLFWRKPLDEVEDLSPEALKSVLETLLNELSQEKDFADIML